MIRSLPSILFFVTSLAFSEPSVQEIEKDIRSFQQFFIDRFPSVPILEYNQGASALPQNADQKLNWKLLQVFPPYEKEMLEAKADWQAELSSGISLAQCFRDKPVARKYPYILAGKVYTIVADINRCLEANGEQALDGMSTEMGRLVATFKAQEEDRPMDIDFRDQEMRRLYEIGREYFWAKRGQKNFSCANCHIENAGNQLRGDVLSAALGHGTGYPAYSISGALSNKPIVTLHRRYAQCHIIIGAVPLPAQSEAYIGLEVYQAVMNRGILIKVPSLRP